MFPIPASDTQSNMSKGKILASWDDGFVIESNNPTSFYILIDSFQNSLKYHY